jgi:hypothetical protein
MGWLTSLFSGGLVKSVENIASEWIETDMETAEAKSLMIKTLDPNGKMRRDLSRFACKAYLCLCGELEEKLAPLPEKLLLVC